MSFNIHTETKMLCSADAEWLSPFHVQLMYSSSQDTGFCSQPCRPAGTHEPGLSCKYDHMTKKQQFFWMVSFWFKTMFAFKFSTKTNTYRFLLFSRKNSKKQLFYIFSCVKQKNRKKNPNANPIRGNSWHW